MDDSAASIIHFHGIQVKDSPSFVYRFFQKQQILTYYLLKNITTRQDP